MYAVVAYSFNLATVIWVLCVLGTIITIFKQCGVLCVCVCGFFVVDITMAQNKLDRHTDIQNYQICLVYN